MKKGKRKSKENLARKLENSTLKTKKSMSGGGLGALGGDWEEKYPGGCLGRFWPIWDRRGMPKMAARWPNLSPRRGQNGAKMAQDLGADWGFMGGLGLAPPGSLAYVHKGAYV